MKKRFAVMAIIAAVAAAYGPALWNGFVWDDTALILRDPLIRSWRLIPEGFNHFLFVDATASDFYRPLQRLIYTLDYAAFSFAPAGYHFVNIAIHAGAAIALLFFAEQLLLLFGMPSTRSRWTSAIVAFIWAIHPVHSAAVVYVSGLADPLAALFGFTGCYVLLRSRSLELRQAIPWLLGATLAFLLAALSKESGLIFPILALVIALTAQAKTAVLRSIVISLIIGLAYFSLRAPAEHHPPPSLSKAAPLAERPITMARAVAEYAGLVALPLNLHMERELDGRRTDSMQETMNSYASREMQTLLGALLIGAILSWCYRSRTRNPIVFRLLVLSIIAYLPISGVIALNAPVAEHWIYIPTAFFFLAIASEIVRIGMQSERRVITSTLSIAIASWAIFLIVRTDLRTFDWKDQRTFLERTLASGGDSTRMLINLGGLELSEGHLDQARKLFDSALKREPQQPLAVINLAVVALRQNDFKTARALAMRATQMPWVDAQAHELIAILDNKELGSVNPLRLRLAARTGPPNWSIERRYIRFMDESGATDAAIRELETCLQTEWYRAESWQLLAQLLGKSGLRNEAAVARAQAAAYDVHLEQRSIL
jgi:protein O-mannosyl-transferase